MMTDYYFEESRPDLTHHWEHNGDPGLAEQLGLQSLRYRIYYSKDKLTRRIFILYGGDPKQIMDLGFVGAANGDTSHIPDKSGSHVTAAYAPGIEWKITNPGESTAFCNVCDVELVTSTGIFRQPGRRKSYGCPKCNHVFE